MANKFPVFSRIVRGTSAHKFSNLDGHELVEVRKRIEQSDRSDNLQSHACRPACILLALADCHVVLLNELRSTGSRRVVPELRPAVPSLGLLPIYKAGFLSVVSTLTTFAAVVPSVRRSPVDIVNQHRQRRYLCQLVSLPRLLCSCTALGMPVCAGFNPFQRTPAVCFDPSFDGPRSAFYYPHSSSQTCIHRTIRGSQTRCPDTARHRFPGTPSRHPGSSTPSLYAICSPSTFNVVLLDSRTLEGETKLTLGWILAECA